MRSLITAFSAALAAAFAFTLPASAAAKWSCDGPAYVCGGSSSSVAAPSYGDERPTSRRSAKNTRRETASLTEVERQTVERSARRQRPTRSYDDDSSGSYSLTGKASYYWQPQRVASGGWFNPNAMTAAHKTLPFGTRVRVTNQANGQSVVVKINDRGPYIAGRIIDLSSAAAGAINMKGSGVVPVKVAVLGRG
ncbi:MAG: septal ring lytic transglycosylase RlpA family protein [Hyphomicrobium aestuarii]|nr:septal ring lytic transglycosylase RlpA family protein [Hyphomicrobium aestuarii]